MNEQASEFIARYRVAGLSGVPCSEAELSALEQDVGVRLPAAYKAMLLLMGQEPDPSFTGTDLSIHSLRGMQSAARRLLIQNGRPFELPPNAFVFLSHQGYQFMYFVADGVNDDPAVYYYLEGNPAPALRAARFTDWLCTS